MLVLYQTQQTDFQSENSGKRELVMWTLGVDSCEK